MALALRLVAAVAAAACRGCEGALMPSLRAGASVNVCTADDFTRLVDALVYYIDPGDEEEEIAHPTMFFDRNIIGGREMMCLALTLSSGNNQRTGDVECGGIYDFYFRPGRPWQ